MHSVLITQCLQTDFVGPLRPHDPLPNALHVGAPEAERLLGLDPGSGPLAQLMHWARRQPAEELTILHIRDWHDAHNPKQRAHLDRFGPHCIAGTSGAELVLDLDDAVNQRENEHHVDALTLNDFEDTRLGEVIAELPRPLRVGVVGVWTEAKVTFLLYELLSRCQITELATCSALTASASRAQHFNALDQLRKVLGVAVHDSVGEFASWLLPEGEDMSLPPQPTGMVPQIQGTTLEAEDEQLVGYLYREAARLEMHALGGGFSGSDVYRVQAFDALGHELAGTVLKLGDRELIGQERVAFEQVEGILGNDAPSVRGFADLGDRAGLKYAFAAMGAGHVRTFKSIYESGADQGQIDAILERVFGEILGRFYSVARYERLPLLQTYTFESRYADGVRDRCAEVLGTAPSAMLEGPDGRVVRCPDAVYRADLSRIERAIGEYHYVSYVHGDLNGANILLDGADNVWLIDFAHAHRGHVIRDLAKLENDLLYIFTDIAEDELGQALTLTDALRQVKDLWAPLPESVDGVTAPSLVRAWATLRTLRRLMAQWVREDRDPAQLSVALLRYAVHTLWFDEASPVQKQWAALAAGGHGTDVLNAAERNLRLRLDWVETEAGGRMGLTLCPGRADRKRDLGEDLDVVRDSGATRLLTLISEEEARWAGVSDIAERAKERGLAHRWTPIVDQMVPDAPTMAELTAWVREATDNGEDVVIHCMGGLGRSGMVAACVLVEEGLGSAGAIDRVRAARSPRAVETEVQENFVHDWISR